jgi:benzoyl-CoA reductase/2-hydroxyglutaryl-CoA dehydratase subunit BcrC/BadD/HgdB
VAELDVDGVIYVNQKHCEPHVHNYLSKAEILKQMKIHVLMFEVEHDRSALSAGDMLRLESFIEIAKRR